MKPLLDLNIEPDKRMDWSKKRQALRFVLVDDDDDWQSPEIENELLEDEQQESKNIIVDS